VVLFYIEAVGSSGWTNFPAPAVISFPNFAVPQWPQHHIFETGDAHTFVNVSMRLCNFKNGWEIGLFRTFFLKILK
jgi:hypothetical protein